MELNGKDVVSILNACAKANVRHLKIGELEVSFDDQPIVNAFEMPPLGDAAIYSGSLKQQVPEPITPYVVKEEVMTDYEDLEEMINDPSSYIARQTSDQEVSA